MRERLSYESQGPFTRIILSLDPGTIIKEKLRDGHYNEERAAVVTAPEDAIET